MQPKAGPAPATTPDFSARGRRIWIPRRAASTRASRGRWLADAAPAYTSSTSSSGWNFAHEDLLANQGGVVGGTPLTDNDSVNHGTATLGVFSGDGVGVTGICRDASVSAIASANAATSAAAIHSAADRLSAGDIILIEMHRAGPRANTPGYTQQQGYLPLEWWPDDYDAIRYANAKGVIVIEAAGNGGENLDDPFYNTRRLPVFPRLGPIRFRAARAQFGRDSGRRGYAAAECAWHRLGLGSLASRFFQLRLGAGRARLGSRGDDDRLRRSARRGASVNTWYTDHFAGTSRRGGDGGGCRRMRARCDARERRAPHAGTRARCFAPAESPQQDGTYPATPTDRQPPRLASDIGRVREWRPTRRCRFTATGARRSPIISTRRTSPSSARAPRRMSMKALPAAFISQNIAGTVPLYRYWNSQLGDHFFTTDYSEIGAGKYGWVFEGPACYVHVQPIAGTIPLYRYWNPTAATTTSRPTGTSLGNGKNGWVFEKIQCYVHA